MLLIRVAGRIRTKMGRDQALGFYNAAYKPFTLSWGVPDAPLVTTVAGKDVAKSPMPLKQLLREAELAASAALCYYSRGKLDAARLAFQQTRLICQGMQFARGAPGESMEQLRLQARRLTAMATRCVAMTWFKKRNFMEANKEFESSRQQYAKLDGAKSNTVATAMSGLHAR